MSNNNSPNIVMCIIGAILVFIGGMILALIALWLVNFIEYVASITIGNMMYSVISENASWHFLIIIAFITMSVYTLVSLAPMRLVMQINTTWLRRTVCVLMGLTLIALLDPNIKFYLPVSIFSFISTLQEMYYIVQGSELAGLITGTDTAYSMYDYIAFDVYTLGITILYFFL